MTWMHQGGFCLFYVLFKLGKKFNPNSVLLDKVNQISGGNGIEKKKGYEQLSIQLQKASSNQERLQMTFL